MAYIGNIPAEKFTSVDIQNFTVSATANYTLDRPVANENEIELFINNVRQHPGSGKAYTASGTALTLSEATAGTDTMYCVYQGKARQTVTPATSSVTNAMLAGSIDLTSKVTGALPQANIADEAINEAKMQISNAPTNGYMLTAQSGNTGGLTWAEAPSSNLVKIHSGSVSPGDGYVALTNKFSSTYKIYKIFLYDWNTSQDSEVRLRWLTGGSGNVESGANTYHYAGVGFNTDGQGSSWSGTNDYGKITGETVRHDSDEHFAWEGTLYNPAGTTLKKRLVFAGGGRRTGNYGFNGHGTLEWNSTTAITGVRFFTSAGTFDSLSFAIYGIVT